MFLPDDTAELVRTPPRSGWLFSIPPVAFRAASSGPASTIAAEPTTLWLAVHQLHFGILEYLRISPRTTTGITNRFGGWPSRCSTAAHWNWAGKEGQELTCAP